MKGSNGGSAPVGEPSGKAVRAFLRWLRAAATRLFFSNFFRLLLVAISISEWGILAWMFPQALGAQPLPVHAAAVVLVYAANRALAGRTQRQRRDRNPAGTLPRFYYAFAFTCLFCFAFLTATGLLWTTVKVCLGALPVEAGTITGTVLDARLDAGFRWTGNLGVIAIVLAFLYGYTFGQRRLRVTQLRLPLRHLPARLHGLRIVQISDLHIGQNLDADQLGEFVTRVNHLQPDLVCITGDIADGPASDLDTYFPILAGLRSRYGVYAILGNHDHYAHADWVAERLRALTPFAVLRDEHSALQIEGESLHIIGLDDRGRDWARGVTTSPSLSTALRKVPTGEPVILLCHRPDIFPQAAEARIGLTLAGHTHGGQIAIPWIRGRTRNLAEFITAFDRGLFEQNGCYLYVNCGLGVTGQRIRLCTPREITVIELQV